MTFNALSKLNVLCDAQCVPNVKKLPKAADTIVWLLLAAVTAAIALFGTCYDYCVYNPQLKAAEVELEFFFVRSANFRKFSSIL